MRDIDAFEARNSFDALLDRVANGEEVPITRRGEIAAGLVPAVPGVFDRAEAARAACGLLDASRGVAPGGIGVNKLVAEGRP